MKLKLKQAIYKQVRRHFIQHLVMKQHMKSLRTVSFKLLNNGARMPTKGSLGAAGFDLYASENVTVPPRDRALIPTGLSLQIPFADTYARIAPRSGLSVQGLDIGAGVVDRDYRGEVRVLVINHTDDPHHFLKGERIAQLIFEKIVDVQLLETDTLEDTERGRGGFGSTGK